MQIAQAADAGRYAADTLGKAQDLLRQAYEARDRKAGMTVVVTLARQSAQTAEDARAIATQRKQHDELAQSNGIAWRARKREQAQAEAAAQTAQTQARRGTGLAPAGTRSAQAS